MKIAIFHLGFYFSGGGERLVIEEAKGLRKLGHEVDIFAPIVDRKRCYPDLIKDLEIKRLFLNLPFRFPLRDFMAILGSLFITPLTFWRFYKYDIFFGANQPGHAIAYLLTRIIKKPYVIYLALPARMLYLRQIDKEVGFGKGSYDFLYLVAKGLRPLAIKLDRISVKNATLFLSAGDYIARVFHKMYFRKPNSCPPGTFPAVRSNTISRFRGEVVLGQKLIQKPYILLTNRHFPQKRFEYMIAGLPYLLQRKLNVRLVITGDTTVYTALLKRIVSFLGVGDRVFFTGLLSENDLANVYKNAAVYVYTAPEEEFGMGVIEAMGYGIPVVAWRNGGPATIIKHGQTGYLIKKDNFMGFVKGVEKLLLKPKLNQKMGESGRLRAIKEFSYSRHIRHLSKSLIRAYSLYYA